MNDHAHDVHDLAPLLTLAEVADILSLSHRSVRRLVLAGELEVVQVGPHSPRIPPASVSRFIQMRSGSRRT